MKPKELAATYLKPYKLRNGEIIAEKCPFCNGKDRYKFYVNAETGAFKCYRANNCGEKGSFRKLCEHFGEEVSRVEATKSYTKPRVKTKEPGSKSEEYLKLRGFSPQTWKQRKVSEKDGAIAFPYYHSGELVLMKYRIPSTKQKRIWQGGGGKPVLWGIDECNPNKPLVIVEGEFDALALDESGVSNVVSVPFGAENHEWIKHCWKQIDKFEKVIIWPDNDEAGQDMMRDIIPRIGEWRCAVVKSKYKDANVHLYKEGKESVREAVKAAKEVPIRRLIRLSDVKTLDPAKMERALSSINKINHHLGGYLYGLVSVWTGDSGSGKSTFLFQEMIQCVEQDIPCLIYSSELPHSLISYWMHLQMAGADHVRVKEDSFAKGKSSYYVPAGLKTTMKQWYADKIYLYDHLQSTRPDDIEEVFTNAARRYGCKVFLLDNLMSVSYGGSKGEYYHRQSEFLTKLKEFADKFHCHIHIVAHPKKADGKLKKDDIAGVKELTNKADNALSMMKVDEEDDDLDYSERFSNTIIDILKDRIYGKDGVSIGLKFSEVCKRFYEQSDKEGSSRPYGWENIGKQQGLEMDI